MHESMLYIETHTHTHTHVHAIMLYTHTHTQITHTHRVLFQLHGWQEKCAKVRRVGHITQHYKLKVKNPMLTMRAFPSDW